MKTFFYVSFFALTIVSCDSEKINKPNKDQIISDLQGKKVDGWNFHLEEEILDLEILKTKIYNSNPLSFEDDILKFTIKGDFIDIYKEEEMSGEITVAKIAHHQAKILNEIDEKLAKEYSGEIVVSYKLNDKLNWVFESVNGEIKESFDPKRINLPNNEKIISDLIDEELDTWHFSRKSEFLEMNVEEQNIKSIKRGEYLLTLKINTELQDYETLEYYHGDLTVQFITNKNIGKWKFKKVTGKVSRKPNLEDLIFRRLIQR